MSTRRIIMPTPSPHQNVFLIASSMLEEWQVELNHQLVQAIRRNGFSCTILALKTSHALDEQETVLREVLEDAESYVAGIAVISGWQPKHAEKLMGFAKSFHKPVVFVD